MAPCPGFVLVKHEKQQKKTENRDKNICQTTENHFNERFTGAETRIIFSKVFLTFSLEGVSIVWQSKQIGGNPMEDPRSWILFKLSFTFFLLQPDSDFTQTTKGKK